MTGMALLWTVVKIAVMVGFVFNVAGLLTWYDRRGGAMMQDRIGPNRATLKIFGVELRIGGLLHTAADGVKFFTKEDFLPPKADKLLFSLAPMLAMIPVLVLLAVIPFGDTISPEQLWRSVCLSDAGGPAVHPVNGVCNAGYHLGRHWPAAQRFGISAGTAIDLVVAPLNVGVLFVFAMSGQGIVGAAIAGISSDNKFSLMGALRAASQMVSYEVTMILTIIGCIMFYGTGRLDEMVRWQGDNAWGIFVQPLAFVLFFTAAVAECKRIPFDLPEAAPTDPDVRVSRIRLFASRSCCTRKIRVGDPRPRERHALQQSPHPFPGHSGTLRAAVKPLAPRLPNGLCEARDRFEVPGDAVVPKVTGQLLREALVLLADIIVAVLPTPVRDPLDCPSEAVLRGPLLDDPLPGERLTPVVREAQQIERPRTLVRTIGRGRFGATEVDQSRLGRVQLQAVLAETLRQHIHHPERILLVREQEHRVVRIADQRGPVGQPRLDLAVKPRIEHIVQEDVRQQRRDHTSLRSARVRVAHAPVFEHTRVEPLADEAQQHPVVHPAAKDFPQLPVVQSIEELLDIDLQDPPATHPPRLIAQCFQRLMRRSLRSEAI